MMKINRELYKYPENILELLNNVLERSKSLKYPLLSKRIDFVHILFNQYIDYPITDQIYQLMRRWVNEMTVAGAEDWMKQYWSYVNQYYMFNLSQSSQVEDKDLFKEFHVMVCVMMLYNKHYDWLKHALFFTNTLPPKYPLIPNTFKEIFATYVNLSEKNVYFYLMRYHMKGMNFGAGEESAIEGELLLFISLLMIRLFSVNDYNITYSEPMELPEHGSTIQENRRIISQIEVIIQRVNLWEGDKTGNLERCGLDRKGIDKAKDLLNEYVKDCENEISKIEKNPVKDDWKRDKLKDDLILATSSMLKNMQLPIYKDCNKNLVNKSILVEQTYKLSKELILKGYDYVGSGLADTMVGALILQLRNHYNYVFLLNSPCKTYSVPYTLLGKALKGLCLSKDFVILAQGIASQVYKNIDGVMYNGNKYTFDGAEIIEIISNTSCLLVMKRSDMPTVELRDLNETERQGLSSLGRNNVYSNIDNITWPEPLLKVCQGYMLKVPKHLKYINMRIDFRLSFDDSVINRIENVKQLIV